MRSVFLGLLLMTPLTQGQEKTADARPILTIIEKGEGCCEWNHRSTYLQVFADSRIEWDERAADSPRGFVRRTSLLKPEDLKAIIWAVRGMSGLKPSYGTLRARQNIDSELSSEIEGFLNGKTKAVTVWFWAPVTAENYRELPVSVKTLACSAEISRRKMMHKPLDSLRWCKGYWTGSW